MAGDGRNTLNIWGPCYPKFGSDHLGRWGDPDPPHPGPGGIRYRADTPPTPCTQSSSSSSSGGLVLGCMPTGACPCPGGGGRPQAYRPSQVLFEDGYFWVCYNTAHPKSLPSPGEFEIARPREGGGAQFLKQKPTPTPKRPKDKFTNDCQKC